MSHYLDPVEQRLHDDAERLLTAHGTQPPVEEILAEHQRRRRRWIAGGAVLGVVLATAIVGLGRLRPTQVAEQPVNNVATEPNVAMVAADSVLPSNGAVIPGHLRDQSKRATPVLVITQLGGAGSHALVLLIAEPDGASPRVLATGLYVPERTEQIRLSDFSPVEQAAIRQVLGMSEPVTLHEPI